MRALRKELRILGVGMLDDQRRWCVCDCFSHQVLRRWIFFAWRPSNKSCTRLNSKSPLSSSQYHDHHNYQHHNHHDHDCHGDQSVGKVAVGCLSPNIGRTKFAGQGGRKLQTATRQFLIILNSIFIIAVIIQMFNKIIMVSSYLSFLLHLSQTGKKKNASQRWHWWVYLWWF